MAETLRELVVALSLQQIVFEFETQKTLLIVGNKPTILMLKLCFRWM